MVMTDADAAKPFSIASNFNKLFLGVLAVALLAGIGTGYMLSGSDSKSEGAAPALLPGQQAKTASQDSGTFKDFAEGVIRLKPKPSDSNEYTEGTHMLERQGAQPVALTSSVVDLSKYEGKKVKIYGETQKALKEGWLMDVGKIDEK